MLASGRRASEVADLLEVARETISRWKKLKKFQRLMDSFLEEEREKEDQQIERIGRCAVNALRSVLDEKNNKERATLALNILRTIGFDWNGAPRRRMSHFVTEMSPPVPQRTSVASETSLGVPLDA